MIILGLAGISGFVFIVSTTALIIQSNLPKEMCYSWNWIPYLFVIIASLGVFVGGLVYYTTMRYAEARREKDSFEAEKKALLSCLPNEEKMIIETLLDGPKFQSEIAKETGLGKVKTHRLLKKLEARGIVHIEKIGKTNIVRLVLK